MLATKPDTSPAIPPPKQIITSFRVKLFLNNISRIELTKIKLLFFSDALNK